MEYKRLHRNTYAVALQDDAPRFDRVANYRRTSPSPHPLAGEMFNDFPVIEKVSLQPGRVVLTIPDSAWKSQHGHILSKLEQKVSGPLSLWDKLARLDAHKEDKDHDEKVARVVIEDGIRPYLVKDGGNCEIVDIAKRADGLVVYVRLTGKCKTCDHAVETIRDVMEGSLRKFLPGASVVRVE